MKRIAISITFALAFAACGGASEYERITDTWTRKGEMRQRYQAALNVAVTFKSLQWREAFARKTAEDRGLEGAALEQHIEQAKADDAGPLEFQMIVTTWDRRENDLERGKKSVWRVVLLDEQGMEIEPLEIVRDKRPDYIIRAEFHDMPNFSRAYVARFPRDKITDPSKLRMHMSSPRGGVRLVWSGR
ncbi:MAG TPA: hypothetical protein VK427_07280 [Kofleriaceae bacterium]|nr:hypothetical protein [Kofleriaceae bacterium]